jgi:hypothetical protein
MFRLCVVLVAFVYLADAYRRREFVPAAGWVTVLAAGVLL